MNRAKLLKFYPTLRVRNRTDHSQHIQYVNDSVTIAPNATRPISSDGLLQIPNPALIELVEPTIFDLHKRGVISLGEADEAKEDVKGDAVATETVADSRAATLTDPLDQPNSKTVVQSDKSAQDKGPVELAGKGKPKASAQ